jgi:hypothetical protein
MRREALAAELLLFMMDGAESGLTGGGAGKKGFGVGCLWRWYREKIK